MFNEDMTPGERAIVKELRELTAVIRALARAAGAPLDDVGDGERVTTFNPIGGRVERTIRRA